MTTSTATSQQIIAAARDDDLRERFAAIAAREGVPNPDHFAALNMSALVAVDFDAEGPETLTIAAVLEYAVLTSPPRPGANPAAVTDDQIAQAIERVRETQAATESGAS